MIKTGTIIFGEKDSEFEVLSYLGSGSFGNVYQVQEKDIGNIFAVKTIAAPSDESSFQTFVNEGALALGIRHPNVIEYKYFHDGSKHSDLPPYIIMEFAKDGTLDSILNVAKSTNKPFRKDTLISMFVQLIEGMRTINEKLVHRDLKPENILLTGDTLKITDFGLAKLVAEATRSMTFKGGGSMPYMAPEAWKMDKNTIQLDIYALGVVFYELATLRLPFDVNSRDPQKWMEAHLYEAVRSPDKINPEIGPKIAHIISKMLEKSCAKRFTNWSEISALLEQEEPKDEANRLFVHKMLEKRVVEDSAIQARIAEAERERQERSDFCKLVRFQARQTVIEPLEELIEDFNSNYGGGKARISASEQDKEIRCSIHMPSGTIITFEFRALLSEDFIREVTIDSYFQKRTVDKIVMPMMEDRRVQGWGALSASDGRGLNLLLVEEPGEIYGNWFMLMNRQSPLSSGGSRPEPFAFDLNELEREISLLGVMHVYVTEKCQMNVDRLKDFVAKYV